MLDNNIKNVCGIYKIICSKNNYFYFGQSKKIRNRIQSHIADLKKQSHSNPKMQRSWNKYGSDSFKFEIYEVCREEELNEKEQRLLSEHVGKEECFNISKFVDSIMRGRKASKSHREKIRNSQTGIGNSFYNKKHSEDTVKEIFEKSNFKMPINIIKPDGTILTYESCRKAEKELGIRTNLILKYAKSKSTIKSGNFAGYRVEYLNEPIQRHDNSSRNWNPVNKRKIFVIEKNGEKKEFDSILAAAKFYELKDDTILEYCKSPYYPWKGTAAGIYFSIEDFNQKSYDPEKTVLRIDGDNNIKYYLSLSHAALDNNFDISNLFKIVKNSKKYKNYTWMNLKDYYLNN